MSINSAQTGSNYNKPPIWQQDRSSLSPSYQEYAQTSNSPTERQRQESTLYDIYHKQQYADLTEGYSQNQRPQSAEVIGETNRNFANPIDQARAPEYARFYEINQAQIQNSSNHHSYEFNPVDRGQGDVAQLNPNIHLGNEQSQTPKVESYLDHAKPIEKSKDNAPVYIAENQPVGIVAIAASQGASIYLMV